MAVKDYDITSLSSEATVVAWASAATGDTGNPWELRDNAGAHASVQFSGTYFGGTTAVLQGSNDGSAWYTLNDVAAAAISSTTASYQEFTTAARYIRPSVASGSADGIVVTVILRG